MMIVKPQGESGHESPRDLAERLGLTFSDPLLLVRALTHRSYLNEHSEALEDNERLEFLGDAVLDFLVGAWLYNRFPEMPEGNLTRLRSALVRTENLADFAREVNLGPALLLGHGESEGGGRERPALLCGAFEALIGAIYLEGGLPEVKSFIDPMLESAADIVVVSNQDKDPKSSLQEWAQSQGYGTPFYRTVDSHGPDHAKTFQVEVVIGSQVYASGVGHSKQAAAKAAAEAAIRSLGLEY
jgi:ribonuclease-3